MVVMAALVGGRTRSAAATAFSHVRVSSTGMNDPFSSVVVQVEPGESQDSDGDGTGVAEGASEGEGVAT